MDLLPTFENNPRGFSAVASGILSSDIRLKAGFASARRLMLMGLYNRAISTSRLAFMVTTEREALQGSRDQRGGSGAGNGSLSPSALSLIGSRWENPQANRAATTASRVHSGSSSVGSSTRSSSRMPTSPTAR